MATATKSKQRDNKITRVILPALYDRPNTPIKEIVDPRTGKPVEALYFYDAANPEKNGGRALIEQSNEDVRTGKQGRPAKRWKLTKATRDRIRRQRQREAAKSVEATPEPALA